MKIVSFGGGVQSTALAILLLISESCVAVTQPFISCKSISSIPTNQTIRFVINTNLSFPPPATATDRQVKMWFNNDGGALYTMKQITTVGTGTVYHYFQNHANLEINLPIANTTLTMASAITRKFYTTAQLEYKNSDYVGFPYQVYMLECHPVKPFVWR